MNQKAVLFHLLKIVASEKSISLDLSQSGLNELPEEFFELTHLQNIDLGFNHLTELQSDICKLDNLITLSLRDNEIEKIPDDVNCLSNLVSLDLSGNQISELPPSIQQLDKLKKLDLRNNPRLSIPLEVLERTDDPAFILETYFASHLLPLHEAKVLLVGQGGVGKTALVRRLIHNLPPDETQGKTDGVDIRNMNIDISNSAKDQTDSIRLNIWDFGGQGIYQATHQFFFTSRSVYLVVMNARTGEQESRLQHWLKLAGSLSNNAPTIIVVNQQDEHPLDLDERELKYKYPNLLHVIYTSCVTGEGIEELRRAISEVLSQLPHIHDRFPLEWFELKKKLELMSDNYITYEQYTEYCKEAGINKEKDQYSWVNILHELGVVLSYQDDRRLEGTHVLNPNWVTDGVYRILSSSQLALNKGILTQKLLDDILNSHNYPHHKQHFIVGMMQKFELCFLIPGSDRKYLVPDLLPNGMKEDVESEFFRDNPCLKFQCYYEEFFPSSILSRLMVRMMTHLDRDLSWRNGAVLHFDDNRALIQADIDSRRIFIYVTGMESTRRSLLNSIRMQLQEIHYTFSDLSVSEEIPLTGYSEMTVSYQELCNHVKRGRENYYNGKLDEEFNVNELLNGIESKEMQLERQLQLKLLDEYNLEELKQVCFELNIEYENLPTTKTAMSRELVRTMARRGRLLDLKGAIM
ncbi:MAG: leucine-rich repeat domain-containing protein [Ardenticatenaceae bacterium]|nr:leucine-rich repeat domain-containing protein [Ardenticatenaceae bacterium]MCB9445598.1 leucine-rich repeat domain-containing protein [Ardenticatenaceae bacterium]